MGRGRRIILVCALCCFGAGLTLYAHGDITFAAPGLPSMSGGPLIVTLYGHDAQTARLVVGAVLAAAALAGVGFARRWR